MKNHRHNKENQPQKIMEKKIQTCQRNHLKFNQRKILKTQTTTTNRKKNNNIKIYWHKILCRAQVLIQLQKALSYICPVRCAASTDLLTNLQQCYIQIWRAELELALCARADTQWAISTKGACLLTYTPHWAHDVHIRKKKERKCANNSAVPSYDFVLLISETKGLWVQPSMCTDLPWAAIDGERRCRRPSQTRHCSVVHGRCRETNHRGWVWRRASTVFVCADDSGLWGLKRSREMCLFMQKEKQRPGRSVNLPTGTSQCDDIMFHCVALFGGMTHRRTRARACTVTACVCHRRESQSPDWPDDFVLSFFF